MASLNSSSLTKLTREIRGARKILSASETAAKIQWSKEDGGHWVDSKNMPVFRNKIMAKPWKK